MTDNKTIALFIVCTILMIASLAFAIYNFIFNENILLGTVGVILFFCFRVWDHKITTSMCEVQ